MITVRVGGQVLTEEQIATGGGRSFNYDPDVPGELVYDFRGPPRGRPTACSTHRGHGDHP